jgi:8-oxo-dGTP pyrophosphatase MutT (NUDIX family)
MAPKKKNKAGILIINEFDELLLINTSKGIPSNWGPPKGSIEKRDTKKKRPMLCISLGEGNKCTAACREFREETGYTCNDIYEKKYKYIGSKSQGKVRIFIFMIKKKNFNISLEKVPDKNEITGIGWFPYKSLEQCSISTDCEYNLTRLAKELIKSKIIRDRFPDAGR